MFLVTEDLDGGEIRIAFVECSGLAEMHRMLGEYLGTP